MSAYGEYGLSYTSGDGNPSHFGYYTDGNQFSNELTRLVLAFLAVALLISLLALSLNCQACRLLRGKTLGALDPRTRRCYLPLAIVSYLLFTICAIANVSWIETHRRTSYPYLIFYIFIDLFVRVSDYLIIVITSFALLALLRLSSASNRMTTRASYVVKAALGLLFALCYGNFLLTLIYYAMVVGAANGANVSGSGIYTDFYVQANVDGLANASGDVQLAYSSVYLLWAIGVCISTLGWLRPRRDANIACKSLFLLTVVLLIRQILRLAFDAASVASSSHDTGSQDQDSFPGAPFIGLGAIFAAIDSLLHAVLLCILAFMAVQPTGDDGESASDSEMEKTSQPASTSDGDAKQAETSNGYLPELHSHHRVAEMQSKHDAAELHSHHLLAEMQAGNDATELHSDELASEMEGSPGRSRVSPVYSDSKRTPDTMSSSDRPGLASSEL